MKEYLLTARHCEILWTETYLPCNSILKFVYAIRNNTSWWNVFQQAVKGLLATNPVLDMCGLLGDCCLKSFAK